MKLEKIINGYRGLSKETGLPVRTLKTLVTKGVIPCIDAGKKLKLFRESAVMRELTAREIPALKVR